MNIFDFAEQDGTISISRLLQNSCLPISDDHRLSPAIRGRLVELAIKRMHAQAYSCEVDPDWVL
jgi:hypothetical protein